jgi:hypothetical protein
VVGAVECAMALQRPRSETSHRPCLIREHNGA